MTPGSCQPASAADDRQAMTGWRRMAGTTKADAQRQRVLSASAQIFSKRGYRATSMNEIAAAVGLSKPTLYHYFRSKEEILVRLYENVMDHTVSSARAIAAAAPSPIGALRELITYRVRYTCENQALHKLFFEEEAELPAALLHTVRQRRSEFENILKNAVARHLGSCRHHPPHHPHRLRQHLPRRRQLGLQVVRPARRRGPANPR